MPTGGISCVPRSGTGPTWWKPAFGSLAVSKIAIVAAIIWRTDAVAESGRFYYDVRGGRLPGGAALDGTVHYGLGPAATVRTGLRMHGDEVAVEAGTVMNPLSFLSLSASVEMPAWAWSVSAQAWRSGLNITGSWYRRTTIVRAECSCIWPAFGVR